MRSRYAIAIAAAILIAFGVKLLFFPNPPAEAQSQGLSSANMNVFQMQVDYPVKDLPEQRVDSLF